MRHHDIRELTLRQLLLPVVVAKRDDEWYSLFIKWLKEVDPGRIGADTCHHITGEYSNVRFLCVKHIAQLMESLCVFFLILPTNVGVCQLQDLECPLIVETQGCFLRCLRLFIGGTSGQDDSQRQDYELLNL